MIADQNYEVAGAIYTAKTKSRGRDKMQMLEVQSFSSAAGA